MHNRIERPRIIWLASYPRSGNTFLRTILWQCFGIRSASIYPNDVGGNKSLEDHVGHIEHGPNGKILFPDHNPPLIKTHEHSNDESPAIYVVRDSRAVCNSFYHYHNGHIPLEVIIEGQHRFGTWSSHLESWRPWERPDTLLLKYEDMKNDLPGIQERISAFLEVDILKRSLPERDSIASVDGVWVRKETDWRSQISDDILKACSKINGDMMRKIGYSF